MKLSESWAAFCKEEHIPEDCVLDVDIGEEDDDFDYSGSDESPQTTSCTYGDYGPSNPWDAPGMSIRDFI